MLQEDNKTLDEVVITGYGGTQLRSKMTNSIAKVDNSTLSTGAHTNPAQALSGAVAGLRVQQTSGNPNSTLFGKTENWACVTYHRARGMIRTGLEENENEK